MNVAHQVDFDGDSAEIDGHLLERARSDDENRTAHAGSKQLLGKPWICYGKDLRERIVKVAHRGGALCVLYAYCAIALGLAFASWARAKPQKLPPRDRSPTRPFTHSSTTPLPKGYRRHGRQDSSLQRTLPYEELVSRMTTLEAASDPVEQFERLTGRRIAQAAQPSVGALPETEVLVGAGWKAPEARALLEKIEAQRL